MSDVESDKPAMWRVRYVRGNSTGSSGEVTYFEDVERMCMDVFDIMLSEDCDDRCPGRGSWWSRTYRRKKRPDLEPGSGAWRPLKLTEVAYLKGTEWVPVKVTYTAPHVDIDCLGGSET